jgi:hypothetical protein
VPTPRSSQSGCVCPANPEKNRSDQAKVFLVAQAEKVFAVNEAQSPCKEDTKEDAKEDTKEDTKEDAKEDTKEDAKEDTKEDTSKAKETCRLGA